jgi:hypothetical protein
MRLGKPPLCQLSYTRDVKWAEQDSNLRRVAPSDLQSDAIGRSAICPFNDPSSYPISWPTTPDPVHPTL